MSMSRRCVRAGFASVFLASGLVPAFGQTAAYDPPYPTREQREAIRKSHVWLGTRQAPRTMQEEALLAAQDDVDIQKYFLDLDFVPTTRIVSGSVTITGKSLVAGFQHLVLDLYDN